MSNTMKHLNISTAIAALFAVGIYAPSAAALDGVVRGKVGYGMAHYQAPSIGTSISSTYSTLSVGSTYILPSHVFADFTFKTTGPDAYYHAGAAVNGLVTADQPFSRKENSLTLGMPLENGVLVSGGIFHASSHFTAVQNATFSQKTTGLTLGAGIGYPIDGGQSGVIGFNAAGALLKGHSHEINGDTYGSKLGFGYSFGALYNYSFNEHVTFSADVKYQAYELKFPDYSGDEKILGATVSLISQF